MGRPEAPAHLKAVVVVPRQHDRGRIEQPCRVAGEQADRTVADDDTVADPDADPAAQEPSGALYQGGGGIGDGRDASIGGEACGSGPFGSGAGTSFAVSTGRSGVAGSTGPGR